MIEQVRCVDILMSPILFFKKISTAMAVEGKSNYYHLPIPGLEKYLLDALCITEALTIILSSFHVPGFFS